MLEAKNAQEQNLLDRSAEYISDALGLNYTVRNVQVVNGRKTEVKTSGVITHVEPGYFKYTTRRVMLVFKVTMECGANKTVREFNLSTLPR